MTAREVHRYWRDRGRGITPAQLNDELARTLREISVELFGHRDNGNLPAGAANAYAGTLKAAADRLEGMTVGYGADLDDQASVPVSALHGDPFDAALGEGRR